MRMLRLIFLLLMESGPGLPLRPLILQLPGLHTFTKHKVDSYSYDAYHGLASPDTFASFEQHEVDSFDRHDYDYNYEDSYSDHHGYSFPEPLFYDVRYDLPEDIIRNKRDSRFFPGHVPAGVRGITKQVLSFIQNTVNPIGFQVEELGKSDSEHHFGAGFEKSPDYLLDTEDLYF